MIKDELKCFDIDLDKMRLKNDILDQLGKAIEELRMENYPERYEVVLNKNLIKVKDKFSSYTAIFGCKISYEQLEKSILFIVRPLQEKTADDMFLESNYKIDICEDYGIIRYKHIEKDYYIRFYLEDKEFDSNKIIDNENFPLEINMKLLKAINKKCQELGWI